MNIEATGTEFNEIYKKLNEGVSRANELDKQIRAMREEQIKSFKKEIAELRAQRDFYKRICRFTLEGLEYPEGGKLTEYMKEAICDNLKIALGDK